MHSLPPKLTVRAWAWDCGSAAPSLNRTGAACGLLTTLRAGQDFVSHYLPKARNATQLCRQIALRPAAEHSESGRGLELVDALAADWGFRYTPTGKFVFFTLDAPDPDEPGEDCAGDAADAVWPVCAAEDLAWLGEWW